MKVLITAGPTREALDPMRYISNRSSGKMGYALAEAAVSAGHETVLVSGPCALTPPEGLAKFVKVISAADMAEAVKAEFPAVDAAIMCAAVADYRPKTVSSSKIKKSGDTLILELEPTEDILASLGKMKRADQLLIGFAAETDNMEKNALGKLQRKNLDWIAANRLDLPGQGAESNTNTVILFSVKGDQVKIPLSSKREVAEAILKITGVNDAR
jgi:phosphopantothenoylcysteine decarboxylase/phosphopantothenate--cysteine ligase